MSLLTELDADTTHAALERIAATAELSVLLSTIESGTNGISNLIRTVKQYTNLDQAPIQNVDIVGSLETTLGSLTHILRPGVKVIRAYQPIPLLVNTVGTELNQVWTNIIENAIEALVGQGELRLRTFCEDQHVVVEIADTGPGIPLEIKPFIFDPFSQLKGSARGPVWA